MKIYFSQFFLSQKIDFSKRLASVLRRCHALTVVVDSASQHAMRQKRKKETIVRTEHTRTPDTRIAESYAIEKIVTFLWIQSLLRKMLSLPDKNSSVLCKNVS